MNTEVLVALIGAMGVVAAAAVKIWDIRTKRQEEAKVELLVLLVQSTGAAIALGEAAAHALQRGHTNGDTQKALEYAAEVKHKQKEFLAKQGIHAMY